MGPSIDPVVLLRMSAATVLGATTKRRLAAMDLLPRKGRSIAWPGDGSLLDAWRHCEDSIIKDASLEEFRRYRLVKARLRATHLPASARTLEMVRRHAGDQPVTRRLIVRLIGLASSRTDLEAAGLMTPRVRSMSKVNGRATLDDLLQLFPEQCRERLREQVCRDVIPAIAPPAVEHIARVLALKGEAWQRFAALGLLSASARRRCRGLAYLYVQIAEWIDALVPACGQCDQEAVTAVLESRAAASPTRVEARFLYQYGSMLAAVTDFLGTNVPGDREALLSDLPAWHRDPVSFRKRMGEICSRASKRGYEARVERVENLVPSLDRIMIAADNRVAQLEAAFLKVIDCVAKHRGAAAGQIVSLVWPVVRADGSIGDGRQIVRFQLRTEWDLIVQARAHAPRDEQMEHLFYNCRSNAARSDRLHVVYLDTRPLHTEGECVEPFFIDICRYGLLEESTGLSPEDAQRRSRMLKDAGVPAVVNPVEGLLHASKGPRATHRSLRNAMGSHMPVIVPLQNLLHAMRIGCVLVRMASRWGVRLGESRQLRMGCLSTEKLHGRERIIARLRPKGWIEEANVEIDPATLEQIGRIKEMAHARWFPDEFEGGKPALPVFPFKDPLRPNAPSARYILIGPTGPLDVATLTNFIRFLLMGVADARSHDLRYLFATALGLDDVPNAEIGANLNHRKGSYTTKRYNVSARIRAGSQRSHRRDAGENRI